jgi:hypothetical protein
MHRIVTLVYAYPAANTTVSGSTTTMYEKSSRRSLRKQHSLLTCFGGIRSAGTRRAVPVTTGELAETAVLGYVFTSHREA